MDIPYTRYVVGGTTDVFSDRLGYWSMADIEHGQPDDITLTITPNLQFRPDLVSYIYYKRTDLEWLVLQYNYILDINEEFITGNTITIPSYDRVFSSILINLPQANVINSK